MPPALLDSSVYNSAFKLLMAACGLAALFALAMTLLSLGAGRRRLYGAAALFALSPIAVGPISLNTYDLWPAALTIGALAALLRRRELLAFALLGLAVTAKVYAAVLVVPALLFVWAWRGGRRVAQALLVFAGTAAAVLAPFALFGAEGIWDSFHAQASRALQVESLGAAPLLAADRLGLYAAEVVRGSTGAISRDLSGTGVDVVGTVTSLVQVTVVALVWLLHAQRRRSARALATAFAAAVAGFLAWNRFVSPQYVVWLIPLVLAVPGTLGAVSWALLGVALVLAQLWFFHYEDVFALGDIVWLVVLRDAVLLVLSVVLVVALARAAEDEDAVLGVDETPGGVSA